MSRRQPDEVWDCICECTRPAPSEAEVDRVLTEIAPKLSALGMTNGLRVAGDVLAILLNGDDVQVGGKAFAKYLEILCNYIAARARQLEKADANLPEDFKRAPIQ